MSIDPVYKAKIQKIINSTLKGKKQTTAKIFSKQWTIYYKLFANGIISKNECAQKKRKYGRAFTKAVQAGEYQNIEYTGKNSQKASTFRIF